MKLLGRRNFLLEVSKCEVYTFGMAMNILQSALEFVDVRGGCKQDNGAVFEFGGPILLRALAIRENKSSEED